MDKEMYNVGVGFFVLGIGCTVPNGNYSWTFKCADCDL